jgi:ATP-binding protein involved in chromosome partitioning
MSSLSKTKFNIIPAHNGRVVSSIKTTFAAGKLVDMADVNEKILESLKTVFYFPKSNDIVSLNMIKDIKVEGNNISLSVIFDKPDEKSIPILRKAIDNAIKTGVDENAMVKVEFKTYTEALSAVKHIVAVASGKGGVGKSTVAANLAIALQKTGAKVGIIDADIYGPSIPIMFDLEGAKPTVTEENGKASIIPIEKYGIKVQSIGFFVEQEQALIWRGPMASNALNQLFNDTVWGELDYLVVDLPPGTGDIHLTLVQSVPVSGIAIVSTPQEVALADARKAFSMFNSDNIKVPILGLIENMSYFSPPELPDNRYYIFGKEGGRKLADNARVNLLGEIPIVESICESGDSGRPVVLDENSPVYKAFMNLAENIKALVESKD